MDTSITSTPPPVTYCQICDDGSHPYGRIISAGTNTDMLVPMWARSASLGHLCQDVQARTLTSKPMALKSPAMCASAAVSLPEYWGQVAQITPTRCAKAARAQRAKPAAARIHHMSRSATSSKWSASRTWADKLLAALGP